MVGTLKQAIHSWNSAEAHSGVERFVSGIAPGHMVERSVYYSQKICITLRDWQGSNQIHMNVRKTPWKNWDQLVADVGVAEDFSMFYTRF